MTIEEALKLYLTPLAPSAGGRIYPGKLPEGPTLPAVVTHRISAPRSAIMAGPAAAVTARYQFDCWAETLEQAMLTAGEVMSALDGFEGMMGGASGWFCQISIVDDRRLADPESGWERWAVDAEIFYR